MQVRPSAIALTPLLLFLTLFFGAGIWFTLQGEPMGFYQLSAPVAILSALALAAWLAHRRGLRALDELLAGMGDSNLVLMCLLFLLAGAFAMVSKAIGAVDAVVTLGLGTMPPAMTLPGLFLVVVFVSLSLGTSIGTDPAVGPVRLGVHHAPRLDRALGG